MTGVVCMLAVSCLGMALTLMKARTEVVLVPTMVGDMSITTGRPSAEYLESMTRDVASLFLNRHPNNTDYFQENILRVVDASVYSQMERELAASRQERIRTRTSTVFHPLSIYVDPDEAYTEIHGQLRTYVGPQEVEQAEKTFAARWTVSGLTVRLLEFVEIEPSNSRARD